MLREQATIEWSRRVISIVACCHGAKLCAHAAQDFRSQKNGAVTRMWRSCGVQLSHKEHAIGVVRCEKEGMLLTPLCMWREQAIMEWFRRVISIVFAASVQSSVHMALGISDRNNTCLLSMSERTRTKKKVKENKGRNKERNPLRKWTVGNPFLQHQVTWRLTGSDKQKLPMLVNGNRFQMIQQATRGGQKQSLVYNDSDWSQKCSQQKTGNFCCRV